MVKNNAKVIALMITLQISIILTEKAFTQEVQGWMDTVVVKPFGYFEYEGNLGTARLLPENDWRGN